MLAPWAPAPRPTRSGAPRPNERHRPEAQVALSFSLSAASRECARAARSRPQMHADRLGSPRARARKPLSRGADAITSPSSCLFVSPLRLLIGTGNGHSRKHHRALRSHRPATAKPAEALVHWRRGKKRASFAEPTTTTTTSNHDNSNKLQRVARPWLRQPVAATISRLISLLHWGLVAWQKQGRRFLSVHSEPPPPAPLGTSASLWVARPPPRRARLLHQLPGPQADQMSLVVVVAAASGACLLRGPPPTGDGGPTRVTR